MLTRVSTEVESNSSLIPYPLLISLPNYLRRLTFLPAPPPPPLADYAAPPSRAVIRRIETTFTLTADKSPTDHHSSGDKSVVVPAAASDKDLPPPRLWRFVSAVVVNDDSQSWPIRYIHCYFILTATPHLPFLCTPPSFILP